MSYLVLGLSFILVILISGCLQQESYQFGQINGRNNKSNVADKEQHELAFPEKDITQTKGLGNLCSSLHECFVFCKSNVGLCFDFCKKNPTHELCVVPETAKSQAWIKDAITQPLPEGASKVRLVLYAPLDAILLKEVGAYGVHAGGHSEGLDHEWLPVKEDVVIRSWADGYVVWARPAPGDAGYDKGQMNVVIYYGDGLWGEHMGLDRNRVLVKEGQRVKVNDPIGYGLLEDTSGYGTVGYQFGEFNLADQHRRDGVGYWYTFVKGATLVSPFDYLQDDEKQRLEERWQKEIISAYLLKGEAVLGVVATPWEPYLTNPILFHREHNGTFIGEWFLRNSPWEFDNAPDILVFFTNNTKYYNKQRVTGVEDSRGQPILSGDWDADYDKGRLIINTSHATYYGIFKLDESEEQAQLKIEYQEESYPDSFSQKALTYTERATVSKSAERFYWKYPEYDPRNW